MTTSLTYWNPALRRNSLDRIFNSAFHDFLGNVEDTAQPASTTWAPVMDIRETAEAITLFAELPGLGKEDVDIRLEDGTLTVKGERNFEKAEGENYHRVERTYGQFTRSFKLPSNVDSTQVEAKFSQGVLSINIPKAEEAKPHRIEIK